MENGKNESSADAAVRLLRLMALNDAGHQPERHRTADTTIEAQIFVSAHCKAFNVLCEHGAELEVIEDDWRSRSD